MPAFAITIYLKDIWPEIPAKLREATDSREASKEKRGKRKLGCPMHLSLRRISIKSH